MTEQVDLMHGWEAEDMVRGVLALLDYLPAPTQGKTLEDTLEEQQGALMALVRVVAEHAEALVNAELPTGYRWSAMPDAVTRPTGASPLDDDRLDAAIESAVELLSENDALAVRTTAHEQTPRTFTLRLGRRRKRNIHDPSSFRENV